MAYRYLGGVWRALSPGTRRFFIRRFQTTFTVSAAAVVLDRENRVLILHHRLRPKTGWGLPGGFLDAGEQPSEAIVREIMEETGLELRDIRMLYVRTLGRHVEILFAGRADGQPQILSGEIDHAGWYSFDEIPPDLPPHDQRTVERVLRGEV